MCWATRKMQKKHWCFFLTVANSITIVPWYTIPWLPWCSSWMSFISYHLAFFGVVLLELLFKVPLEWPGSAFQISRNQCPCALCQVPAVKISITTILMSCKSTPLSSWRIIQLTYCWRGNESNKRHNLRGWRVTSDPPFLGGLVDWPLHTSDINAIQLSNRYQPFQLQTHWWCSLATFAQFLSHEQQHFHLSILQILAPTLLAESQTRYDSV